MSITIPPNQPVRRLPPAAQRNLIACALAQVSAAQEMLELVAKELAK